MVQALISQSTGVNARLDTTPSNTDSNLQTRCLPTSSLQVTERTGVALWAKPSKIDWLMRITKLAGSRLDRQLMAAIPWTMTDKLPLSNRQIEE